MVNAGVQDGNRHAPIASKGPIDWIQALYGAHATIADKTPTTKVFLWWEFCEAKQAIFAYGCAAIEGERRRRIKRAHDVPVGVKREQLMVEHDRWRPKPPPPLRRNCRRRVADTERAVCQPDRETDTVEEADLDCGAVGHRARGRHHLH